MLAAGAGVAVTADHHMRGSVSGQILDERCCGQRLPLPFKLGPPRPRRSMIDQQQTTQRLRGANLSDDCSARVVARSWRHVQIDLVHSLERPPARDRRPVVTAIADQSDALVGDVVGRAEQVNDLVVLLVDDCFLEGDQVGL